MVAENLSMRRVGWFAENSRERLVEEKEREVAESGKKEGFAELALGATLRASYADVARMRVRVETSNSLTTGHIRAFCFYLSTHVL
jgi:hypothetical protein